METVPKIVEERLKARAVTVDHPDADVLTAFSERALLDRERDGVLEHLARCAECRQVVVLALPAEESALLVVRPLRSPWLSRPRLRWGMIAAGVIVIGWLGALRYRTVSHPGLAGSQKPSQTAAMTVARNQPPAALDALPRKKAEDLATRSGEAARLKSRTRMEFDRSRQSAKLEFAPGDNGVVAGVAGGPLRPRVLSHAPKPPVQQGQQSMNAKPVARPPVPGPLLGEASNVGMVTAQAAAVTSDKKAGNLDGLALNGPSMTSLAPLSTNSGGEVARAKPAETTAAAQSPTAQGHAVVPEESSNFSPSGSLVAESSRWTINPVGGLERSLDQGKTWQEVDVNGGAETPDAIEGQLALKDSRTTVAAKQKTDRKPKPLVFRAVAAKGPDVWVGGAEGNLYHSTDSGDHWVKVVPSWRGIELSGDILNLQFADRMHGRIVTSTAEIWTTPDAGQTWDKR